MEKYNVYVYNKAMMAQGICNKESAGKAAYRLPSFEAVKQFIDNNVNLDYESVCIEKEVEA